MFERFTDRARRVVVLAQEEARLLSHNYIGTEHILLGLIHESEGVAARVLAQLGISLEAVRAQVESIIGEGGPGSPSGHIPFTTRSKKVLELSLREALALGHNYIGTEHILLGLIREGEGVGAHVLVSLGADLAVVRQAAIQLMSGTRGGPPGVRMRSGGGQRPQQTPAAARVGVEAHRLAGGGAVGSQHYLLGLLQEQESMAAKALASLGITREAVEAKLAELEPAGTSDETPEQAGARRIGLRVEGKLVTLEIDDPELAASLEKAMVGRKVRVIRGSDPEAEAAGFPNLWSAVSRTVDDLTRRLGRASFGGVVRAPGPVGWRPPADWRPPGWHEGGHAASYWVLNTADGALGHLEVADEADRDPIRAWIWEWLTANGPGLAAASAGGTEAADCRSLWAYVDRSGDAFRMTSFGFGAEGPPGSGPIPLHLLVHAALLDLSAEV